MLETPLIGISYHIYFLKLKLIIYFFNFKILFIKLNKVKMLLTWGQYA
jgi:hypothetical protein